MSDQIKVEQVARPGSIAACPYPFADLKVVDMDSFLVGCKDTKGVSRVRNNVSSELKRYNLQTPDTNLVVASTVVYEAGNIIGVRFWKASAKK